MRLGQGYLAIVSRLVPLGAVGAAMLLGAGAARAGTEPPQQANPTTVADRLAAIREAVSVVVVPEGLAHQPNPDLHLVWGNRWNNWGWGGRPGWGWGRPGWGNWRNVRPRWNNWRNAWRNW